jgi:hypothetical protein
VIKLPRYCVYCGNPLKETDKFCIICGKPVLRNVTQRDVKKGQNLEPQKPQVKDLKIQQEEDIDFDEESIVEEESMRKKERGSGKTVVEKPLPFEVKEQMILYIEYSDIQLNKELLSEKLKNLQKELKDPRYETDDQFKTSINLKLEAIKTLINELKQKEDEIKQKMDEPFIVQRIQNDIETKIFQLKNLTQEYKLKKVDKETFEKLRERYKQEKKGLEQEREDLISGMKLWIKELKIEKVELNTKRNLNKGQHSAKEISEEQFQEKDRDFDLKLKKIEVKISTLEKLIK